MLFHNSSSDSENSQDTAEVVSPASVSTAIDLLVASVFLLFFDTQGKALLIGKPKGSLFLKSQERL